jgi:hypothetical protein
MDKYAPVVPPPSPPKQKYLGHRNAGYIDFSSIGNNQKNQREKLLREIKSRKEKIFRLNRRINTQVSERAKIKAVRKMKTEVSNTRHEMGFMQGSYLAHRISSRKKQKDVKVLVGQKKKRTEWENWEEEYNELQHIVVHRVLRKIVLDEINDELKDLKEVIDQRFLFNQFSRKLLFEAAEATAGGVGLKKCSCLSGFLDGLKECMPGWLHKKYTDVVVISSLEIDEPPTAETPTEQTATAQTPTDKPATAKTPKATPPKESSLHFDVHIDSIRHYEEEDDRWPVSIYFSLSSTIGSTIWYQPCKGSRGKKASVQELHIPAGSVLIFDPTGFQHCTKKKMSQSEERPDRVNILIHGLEEIKVEPDSREEDEGEEEDEGDEGEEEWQEEDEGDEGEE